jgi:hypothetical protein
MGDSKTLFFSSKFPWTSERIYSKFMDNFGTCPQKHLPALTSKTLFLFLEGCYCRLFMPITMADELFKKGVTVTGTTHCNKRDPT